MFGRLFILFTLVPLLELYLLIKVGSHLGAEFTIVLIVLTGGVGALMARLQGLLTDAVGLALLIPFVRSRVVVWIKDFLRRKIQEGRVHIVAWEGEE